MEESLNLCIYCIARDESTQLQDWCESALSLNPREVLIAVDSRSDAETLTEAARLAREYPTVRCESFVLPECLSEEERAEWDAMFERGMKLTDVLGEEYQGILTSLKGLDEEQRRAYLLNVLHHFAGARNSALAQSDCEWILQMDCDERVHPDAYTTLPSFIRWSEGLERRVDLGMVRIEMQSDNGDAIQRFAGERLLRKGIRYKGAMHNTVPVAEEHRSLCESLILAHNRIQRTDAARNFRAEQRIINALCYFGSRIEKSRAENEGVCQDNRALFYYAGTLGDANLNNVAEPYWVEYLNCAQFAPERAQASIIFGGLLAKKKDYDFARQVLFMGMNDNWRRNEIYYLLGQISYEQRNLEEAEHWYRLAALMPEPTQEFFFCETQTRWQSWAALWELYANAGLWEQAKQARKGAIREGIPKDISPVMEGMQGMNLLLFVDRDDRKFVQPLFERWAERKQFNVGFYTPATEPMEGDVLIKKGNMEDDLEWADVAWFEWAGPLLVEATRNHPRKCRIVARVHGYEVYEPFFQEIDWSKVDDVIFVADYLASIALDRCPEISRSCRIYTVAGGVDTALFDIKKERGNDGELRSIQRNGNKFCMAGYLNSKKQPQWALILFARAREVIPDATLHIVGQWQDARVQKHCQTLIRELNLEGAVFWYKWASQADLADFYQDKDYFISCSYDESLHYALAEAMACGVAPLIHCWESSRDLYSQESIFKNEKEFLQTLRSGTSPEQNRQWVLDHLSLEQNERRIYRILTMPKVTVIGDVSEAWRMESKLARALEKIGCCLVDAPQSQVAFALNGDARPEGVPKVVYWNAEQIVGNDDHSQSRRDLCEKVKATLKEQDLYLQSQQHEYLGGWTMPFRPLGLEKKIDVLFYGVMNERRKAIVEALQRAEIQVAVAEVYDHETLNELINESRIVLNLHCTDAPNVETRLCEALGAGTLVISETLPPSPIDWLTSQIPQVNVPREIVVSDNDSYAYYDVSAMVKMLNYWLGQTEKREALALRLCDEVIGKLRLEQQVERVLEKVGI